MSEQNPIKKLNERFKHQFWQPEETEDITLHEYLKKKKED